jgi:hypothetical protein
LPADWPSYACGNVTQSSRGIEKPTALVPLAKMWIRIKVFVAWPPTPPATPWTLPACIAASRSAGRMLPS